LGVAPFIFEEHLKVMSNLPSDLLIPLFDDPNEGFEAPINVNTHSVAAAGFYPQNSTSANKDAGIYRDSNGNLILKDANTGIKTLAALASGGVSFAVPSTIGTSNTEGVAITAARSDHVHALPAVGVAATYGSGSSVPVFTTDAYGRVSSVSNTSISITSSAVSDFSSSVKTVLGTSVSAGTGISTSVNPTTGVLTLSNSGVTSVNGSTGIITNVVYGDDSRLTNSRTPTAHALSHASSGSDQLTLSQSQITNLVTDLSAKAADSAVVHLIGSETVAGVKTFTSSPIVPTPSASTEAANKSYVDTLAAAISGSYASPVQDLTALRALGLSVRVDKQIRLVEDKGAIYRWDSVGAGSDDSDGTVTPTDAMGRWFKVSAATQSHNGLTGIQGGTANDYHHLTTAQLGTLTGATSTNTASAIVARDASGNFVANVVTATLSGAASSSGSSAILNDVVTNATYYPTFVNFTSGNQIVKTSGSKLTYNPSTGMFSATGFTGSLTGNADTATKLLASKTFALTGDVTGSASTDLTSGPSIATTLASVGTPSTYGSASQVPVFTTDAKGRVTSVTNTSIAIAQAAVTSLTSDLSARPTGSGAAGRVAYWSGTSALTGESTLYWDATNDRLGIGTSSPGFALTVGGSTAQYPTLLSINETAHATSRRASMLLGANWLIGQDSGGTGTKDLFIYDSSIPATRFYIGTTGNVGIGTTSPSYPLHVNGVPSSSLLGMYGVSLFQYDTGTAAIGVKCNDVTTVVGSRSGTDSIIGTSTNHPVSIVSNGTTALTIAAGGSNVTVAQLLTLTNGQIKFPSSQNASADGSTLDDYEEGTWTPTIRATNGTTNYSATRTLHSATYVKIGRLVLASCFMNTISYPSAPTSYRIQLLGLPFANDSTANAYTPFSSNYFTAAAGVYGLGGYAYVGDTFAELQKTISGGTSSLLVSDNMSAVMFTIVYRANA